MKMLDETKPLPREHFVKLGMDKSCSYEHYLYLFNLKIIKQ